MSATATGYLASKPRYEILDGLRGVAAMIVVAFHLLETYSKGPAYQVLNHGYLAVDFFFVLSGFVIGYAYDDRWNCMSLKGFFKRRLVRLHPMVIMGSLIGALFFYFGSAAFPMIAGARSVAVCTFLGEISFPLYITHYPLVYMQMAWVAGNPDAPLGTGIFVNVAIFLLAVGLAWACLKLYDLPVREWLKRHWLMK